MLRKHKITLVCRRHIMDRKNIIFLSFFYLREFFFFFFNVWNGHHIGIMVAMWKMVMENIIFTEIEKKKKKLKINLGKSAFRFYILINFKSWINSVCGMLWTDLLLIIIFSFKIKWVLNGLLNVSQLMIYAYTYVYIYRTFRWWVLKFCDSHTILKKNCKSQFLCLAQFNNSSITQRWMVRKKKLFLCDVLAVESPKSVSFYRINDR